MAKVSGKWADFGFVHQWFVHPIFSSFSFWYFSHFSCGIFFSFFFRLAHYSNIAKHFCIFVTSLPKVTKTKKQKMGWKKYKSDLFQFIISLSKYVIILKKCISGIFHRIKICQNLCKYLFAVMTGQANASLPITSSGLSTKDRHWPKNLMFSPEFFVRVAW